MESIKLLLVTFFIVFYATHQISAEIKLDVDEIKSHLPAGLANTDIKLEDGKKLLKEKCKSVVGEEKYESAYENIEVGVKDLMDCVSEIVNFETVQDEIEKARPKGELDAVFNMYCNKRPEALHCVGNFTDKFEVCLEDDERDMKNTIMKISTSLLNFVCHKGGDQIALFIAEKGPECLQEMMDPIQNCVNVTFNKYQPEGLGEELDIKNLPKLVMGPELCHDMQDFETCIVTALEKCEDITPANIVESMFRFIKNETICRNENMRGGKASSHKSNFSSRLEFSLYLGTISIFLFVKRFL